MSAALALGVGNILWADEGFGVRAAEAAHVPGDQVAKPVLLGDEHSYLLAVIPAAAWAQDDGPGPEEIEGREMTERERLLRAILLPRTSQEARRAGVPEEEGATAPGASGEDKVADVLESLWD